MPPDSQPVDRADGGDRRDLGRADLDTAYHAWSDAAAAVVAKSRRVTVDELPSSAEDLLSTPTAAGPVIRPLYTRRDERPEPGLPGAPPFVRGADPARDVLTGWRVTERFGDLRGAVTVNQQILDAFGSGTSGLWLAVGAAGTDAAITVDTLAAVLDGVYLDLVPLTLDAGAAGIDAARAVLAVRADAPAPPLPTQPTVATILSLGLSPLTAAFSGRPTVDAAAAARLATEVPDGVRTFRVDGTDFADAGADDALELGLAVAAALTHLRDLTDAGLGTTAALGQLTFALSATDDQFATIAKIRALRRVWARVADVLGEPAAGGAVTHAITALSMLTQRDPWVNLLRTTVAAFGAGIGGADQVTVHAYDAALPPAQRVSRPEFSGRVARNTQLLLLEESHLGRVIDPAGGSWFVESLTDGLAAAAWDVFTAVEGHGGYRAALSSGWIGEQVAAALAHRDVEVAHRRTSVTGVNEFPDIGERTLDAATALSTDVPTASPRLARVGRNFEHLRDRSDAYLADTGRRPTVTLLPLGPIAEHNGRTTFVANLLAAGGIDAINPGPVDANGLAAATEPDRAPIAVLCGSRSRYAEDGPAALVVARDRGFRAVLMAGPNREWPESASAPDGTLEAGIDAVAALGDLLDRLDVPDVATTGGEIA